MLTFFPRDVLDEIWDLIESVSEVFPTYSWWKQNVFDKIRLFKFNQSFWAAFFVIGYGVCVFNASHSKRIFFKPCIHFSDIMKMCMWSFDNTEINLDRNTAFET